MTYDLMTTRKYRKAVKFLQPLDIHNFIKRYANKKQEYFLTLTLNGAHEVICVHISTIGLVNRTIIHPREVFCHAISDRASAIVIAHNHPSGNIQPSNDDDEITKRLYQASKILGFNFLDHIIFTKKEYYSYRENKKILEYVNE